jgi:RNA 2',3'-cyclic 3'-phosphodiesterase
MRLFAAVYPPDDVLDSLEASIGARHDGLRWVPAHQWHVTLAFFGSVREDVVDRLVSRLQRAASRTRPITLQLSGAGAFPRQAAKARVVHVGIAGDVEPLARLADRCVASARRVDISVDERKFRPHLTLARARPAGFDAREIVASLSSYESRSWTVNSFRLVHSTLGAVVTHAPLQEFVLSE